LMWIGSLEPPRAAQAADDNQPDEFSVNVSAEPSESYVKSTRREPRRTSAPLSMQPKYLAMAGGTPAGTQAPDKKIVTTKPATSSVAIESAKPVESISDEAPATDSVAKSKDQSADDLHGVLDRLSNTDNSVANKPTNPTDEPPKTDSDTPKSAQERDSDPITDSNWDPIAPGPPPVRPSVTIDAGADRQIWAGEGSITLEAITADGRSSQFDWIQIDGPSLDLRADGSGGLQISGFADQKPSWHDTQYAFEATAVSEAGGMKSDVVKVWSRWAPDLNFTADPEDRPRNRRRFEIVDELPIAHYSCTVSPSNYPAIFMLDADGPLTFNVVTSAAHEFVYSEVSGRHLYELSVYQSNEEPRTELVVYVQSADQIPAVITATVDW
jgi:hypothetical protein